MGKILGEKWKQLSDKEKKPYDEKAKKDKERYESEKASYAAVSQENLQQLLHDANLIRGWRRRG